MAQHIITGSGVPMIRPEHPGQHYIDESADPRVTYIGLSTDDQTPVADCWQEVGSGGGGASAPEELTVTSTHVPVNGSDVILRETNLDPVTIDASDVPSPFKARIRAMTGDQDVTVLTPIPEQATAMAPVEPTGPGTFGFSLTTGNEAGMDIEVTVVGSGMSATTLIRAFPILMPGGGGQGN